MREHEQSSEAPENADMAAASSDDAGLAPPRLKLLLAACTLHCVGRRCGGRSDSADAGDAH